MRHAKPMSMAFREGQFATIVQRAVIERQRGRFANVRLRVIQRGHGIHAAGQQHDGLHKPKRIFHHVRRHTGLTRQPDAAACGEFAAHDGPLRRAGAHDVIQNPVHDVLVEERRIPP